jgi:hypothetical protein
MSENGVDNVAPPFRASPAGLKPGATPEALSRHFVDTTLPVLSHFPPVAVLDNFHFSIPPYHHEAPPRLFFPEGDGDGNRENPRC